MNEEKSEAKRELAYLLAKVKAMEDDETVETFLFDRNLIPQLRASELIEVKIRRTHKDPVTMPIVDIFAGVVTA